MSDETSGDKDKCDKCPKCGADVDTSTSDEIRFLCGTLYYPSTGNSYADSDCKDNQIAQLREQLAEAELQLSVRKGMVKSLQERVRELEELLDSEVLGRINRPGAKTVGRFTVTPEEQPDG